MFDGFLAIYEKRTADLLRIAGVRAGGLPQDLHPDLVSRLTREASKAADQIMRMCIRALDYVPPVDIRFGDFLRAIITADYDLVPDDPLGYRLAIIEGFRRRGIFPEDSLSLAVDSLIWDSSPYHLSIDDLKKIDLVPKFKREDVIAAAESNAEIVHYWITEENDDVIDVPWQKVSGVIFRHGLVPSDDRETIHSRPDYPDGDFPFVEVHSVRLTRRVGPDGQDLRQLIIELAQQRRGFFSSQKQEQQELDPLHPDEADFRFRGGATLIFDLREGHLRYAIRKRISDDGRLARQREFLTKTRLGIAAQAFAAASSERSPNDEPFAFVHRRC